MRKRATERLNKKRRSKDDAAVSDESEEKVSPEKRGKTSMVDMMKESVTMKQKYQEEQGQISRQLDLRAAE